MHLKLRAPELTRVYRYMTVSCVIAVSLSAVGCGPWVYEEGSPVAASSDTASGDWVFSSAYHGSIPPSSGFLGGIVVGERGQVSGWLQFRSEASPIACPQADGKTFPVSGQVAANGDLKFTLSGFADGLVSVQLSPSGGVNPSVASIQIDGGRCATEPQNFEASHIADVTGQYTGVLRSARGLPVKASLSLGAKTAPSRDGSFPFSGIVRIDSTDCEGSVELNGNTLGAILRGTSSAAAAYPAVITGLQGTTDLSANEITFDNGSLVLAPNHCAGDTYSGSLTRN